MELKQLFTFAASQLNPETDLQAQFVHDHKDRV